jgi:hypothetical protein
MEGDDTRTEGPGVQELQSMDAHMLEDTRPFSKNKRIYENTELIHKIMLEHCACQLAHAILHQTLPRRLLELPDLLRHVPRYERSVPLERLLQGSGRDILGHIVYSVRVFSLSGRPDLGEGFVGLLTHQERVGHGQKLAKVFLNIRAVERKNLLPKIHVLSTHSAIDRHFSFYNNFSHIFSPV